MDFGLIVDVETTGLDPRQDKIIELALVEFAVGGAAATGPVITRCYSSLADPGIEIPQEVTEVTGLATAHVRGHSIDWSLARNFFERSSIVIAHNAAFDRSFLEATGKLGGLALHWACSMRHIDWKRHNFATQSLNYLAADHGFLNPFAHRALFDCATTLRLIGPYLDELIARSYEREYLIKAVGSPFDAKDALRARGYRWDSDERVWGRVITEALLAEERAFLAAQVYLGDARHEETVLA